MLHQILLICIFACSYVAASTENMDKLTVIYGTNEGELRVRDVTRNTTLKAIKLMIDNISGGIAIDHQRETIYFADNRRIYQLYAVDNQGKRCTSGELFIDLHVRHIETIFFEYPFELPTEDTEKQLIHSLYFDGDFLHAYMYDPKCNCSREYRTELGWENTMRISDAKLPLNTEIKSGSKFNYVSRKNKNGQQIIYQCKKDNKNCNLVIRNSVCVGWRGELEFFIEQRSDRLFVMQHGGIYVLNENLSTFTRVSTSIKDFDILIADARVTKGIHAFAVFRRTVVWGSSKELYAGTIEDGGKFITSESIRVLDWIQHSQFDNILLFLRK